MLSTPASLLERLRQPTDAVAWDRFVELYSPLLFHWARGLGQQDSDAADLVQDVFLLLWRQLPSFQYDPSRNFHAWLKTVFLNRARQRLRDRAKSAGQQDLADCSDPAHDLAADQEDRHYLLHRTLSLIEREFAPHHVAAFREYVLAGRSVEDVARQFQLSPASVYSIKSRIINRLRHEMAHLLD